MADLSPGLSGPTLGPHVLPAGSAFLACLTELVSTELAYATELSRLVSSPPTDSSSSAASSILAPLLPSVSTRAHALGPAAQALFTAASSSSALPLSPAPPAPAAAAAAAAAGGDVSAAHDAALAALAVLTAPQTPTEAQAWSAYLSAATATVSSSSSAASAASAGSVSVPCRAALLRLSRAESLCLSLPALRPQTAATLGATGRDDLVAAWATAAAVAAAAAPSDEAAEAGAGVARAYDAAAAAARAAAAAIASALGNENGAEGGNIAAAVADAAPMLRLTPPGADCPPAANEAAAEAAAEVAWLLSAAALSFSLAASASVAGASAGPVAAAAAPADLPATAAIDGIGMGIVLSSSLSLLRPGHAGGVRGTYTLYSPLDRSVAGEPGAVLVWDHPVSAHIAANSNSNSNSSYVGSGWLSLRGSLAAARVRGSSRTLRLTLLPSEDAEGSVGEKQPAVLLLRADTDAEADRWVSALSAVADAVAAATAAAAAVGGVRSSTPLPPSLAAEASVLAAAALARQGLTPSATPRPRARSRTPAPAPDGSAAGAEAGAQRRGVSGWSTPQRPLAHSHAHSHAGAGTAARAALARARAREISNSPVPMPPSTPVLAPAGGEQVTVGSVTVGNGVSRTRSRQHSNAGSISEPMDAATHSHVQQQMLFQQQQQQLFEQGRRSRAASLTGLSSSSTAAAAATAASASASASASPAAPVRAQISVPGASRVPATPPHAPRASPAPSVGRLTPSRRLTPSLPRRHRSPALAVAAAVQTTADIALKRIAAVRKIEEDAARAVKEEMARLAAKIEALEKAAREPLPAGL